MDRNARTYRFDRWLANATPGQEYVYFRSGDSKAQKLFDNVMLASRTNQVMLFQRPVDRSAPRPWEYEYVARRISVKAARFLSAIHKGVKLRTPRYA